VGDLGAERPVVRTPEATFDLTSLTDDIDGRFLATEGVRRTREALDQQRLRRIDVDGLRVGPPVARPAAVVCIGQNYAAHAAESGAAAPREPIVFLKHPNTVVGPADDVALPADAERADWEVELAVVIGSRASRLDSPGDALAHVAGYAVSNDVSERVWQIDRSGGQWSKGKCAPTFNPLGPWLVPADELVDPQRLALRSWVNGEARQDSSTSDMIFDVAFLVWHLSQFMALDPGDVVNTGTPEGVALSGRFPYLRPGDVVEMEIEQLGRQRQACVSAGQDGPHR
jgi:2-keto-4-pentenoate hydratase/2-oxohepta-3-ene-1,7-dioic acid hydratase in catechol pathway